MTDLNLIEDVQRQFMTLACGGVFGNEDLYRIGALNLRTIDETLLRKALKSVNGFPNYCQKFDLDATGEVFWRNASMWMDLYNEASEVNYEFTEQLEKAGISGSDLSNISYEMMLRYIPDPTKRVIPGIKTHLSLEDRVKFTFLYGCTLNLYGKDCMDYMDMELDDLTEELMRVTLRQVSIRPYYNHKFDLTQTGEAFWIAADQWQKIYQDAHNKSLAFMQIGVDKKESIEVFFEYQPK